MSLGRSLHLVFCTRNVFALKVHLVPVILVPSWKMKNVKMFEYWESLRLKIMLLTKKCSFVYVQISLRQKLLPRTESVEKLKRGRIRSHLKHHRSDDEHQNVST